jgi:hypothetical protein
MAKAHAYSCEAKIWLYPGESASWHFITLPKALGTTFKETYAKHRRGFGSLPVTVTIGTSTWNTSIFPDSYSGSYLLPLKAAVRKKEALLIGDTITLTLCIRK